MNSPHAMPGRSNGPENLDDILRRLAAFKADGNFPEVLSTAESALKMAPDNKAALDALALAQNRTKNYKGALATAQKAIQIDPKNAIAHANKAFAQGALGNRAAMIEELKAAAELDPQFQAALDKAMGAASAGLFDMPGEVTESKIQGTKAKEGAGLTPEMLKWIIIAAVVLPLTGLIIFFVLRNTVLKTPPPKTASPWPQAPSPAPSAPEKLKDRYQIGRQIGAGGMGQVFEGMDTALDRKIAAKRMLPQLAAQPKLRERFVSEAKTVAALHHANIVDIYDIIEEGQDLYLVFEYVAGKTLAELIASRGRYPYPDALKILRDIAAAVQFAHGQGIIHRDLKPANVMLTEAGRVVVMDFGLARAAQELMSQAAMTNTIVGTPAYMAPEQEEGVVCKQSDVYSLAVCLYEMLAAKRPFDGTPVTLHASKSALKYAPISGLVAGLPAGMDIFFNCALAADPKKRPASPNEFIAALDAMTPLPASR